MPDVVDDIDQLSVQIPVSPEPKVSLDTPEYSTSMQWLIAYQRQKAACDTWASGMANERPDTHVSLEHQEEYAELRARESTLVGLVALMPNLKREFQRVQQRLKEIVHPEKPAPLKKVDPALIKKIPTTEVTGSRTAMDRELLWRWNMAQLAEQ